MTTHTLKTLPSYFEHSLNDIKPFEIRSSLENDFQVGDEIVLVEWDKNYTWMIGGRATGREIKGVITYVTTFEQKPGFVVFSYTKTATDLRNTNYPDVRP
jgi:Domain of unknown function (DUF3850)